jgi:hypothetical protein
MRVYQELAPKEFGHASKPRARKTYGRRSYSWPHSPGAGLNHRHLKHADDFSDDVAYRGPEEAENIREHHTKHWRAAQSGKLRWVRCEVAYEPDEGNREYPTPFDVPQTEKGTHH